MADVVAAREPTRFSRVDWVTLGIGFSILLVSYIWPPIQFLVTFAIFLPPVLREVGLLKDCDQNALRAMHRAGFHALLVLVAMFLVSHGLVRQGTLTETAMSATAILNESYLRGLLVGTYLVSYLLQVLGPRMGSFGVLLGASGLSLAPLPGKYLGTVSGSFPLPGALALVGLSLILLLLAFLVRGRPRAGGWVLTGMFVAGASLLILLGQRHLPIESCLSGLVQMGLLLGCTGLALLRSVEASLS